MDELDDPNPTVTKALASPRAARRQLDAQPIVVPSESEADWQGHVDGILVSFAPANPLEHALALRVAELIWRLRRASLAEQSAVAKFQRHAERVNRVEASRGSAPPFVGMPVMPEPTVLEPIVRYEAHLNRQLLQTMHELEALQERRKGHRPHLARVDFLTNARD